MMTFVVVFMAGVAVVAYLRGITRGRSQVPAPAPAPAPRVFDLAVLEAAREQLGGLAPDQARTARVVAAVTGMQDRLEASVMEARAQAASAADGGRRRVADLEEQVQRARGVVAASEARLADVDSMAATCGLPTG